MKSLYIRWARFGSNSDEWMSTHTDGFLSRKSAGSSVYGIRWNHISFMMASSQFVSGTDDTDQYCGRLVGMSNSGGIRCGSVWNCRAILRCGWGRADSERPTPERSPMNDLAGATSSTALSATACLARARSLIPGLQAAADRIEANNELPSDVLDAMHDARMFRLLLPRSLGGAELRPIDYIQCVEAIAQGDASAAWCMNQGSGCSMAAAYVAPAIACEVFGHPRDVLAWGQGPGAKAIRTDGGWRVTGSWTFASGSRHATWLGAHAPCFEADGTPIRHPDGKSWERTMLFRRD